MSVGAREALDGPVLLLPGDDAVDIEAVRVVDAAGRVGDGDDRGALSPMSRAAMEPGVAEALDGDACLRRGRCQVAGGLDDAVDGATGGGLVAAFGAAQADRLAGDDARDRVALVHRVGVHDPGHDLGVGVDVRGRDVLLGADEDLDLGGEPAGERLELLQASFLGSTMTPPLPPPYGMPTTAHFQVIHIARALTSSRVTSWW